MKTSIAKRIALVFTVLSFLLVVSFTTPHAVLAQSVCSPATGISVPFYFDGAGDFCWQTPSLCTYVNSWNTTTVEINGTAYTNIYVSSSSIAPLNGTYTIHFVGPYTWSHLEIAGTCSSGPTNTPTKTPTKTNTPAGPTNTPTRTNTPTNTQAASQNPMHNYAFDGNANDTGTSPANGTVTGGNYVTGQISQAVNLSGSSQYVSLPSGFISSLNDFSVATWVKLNSISNWTRLFDFGTGTNVYMFLTPQNGSSGVIRFSITTNGNGSEQQISGSSALSTGTWHHIAVTKSGNTGTLYVDGSVVGTNSNMTLSPSSLGTTTQNWIGRSQFSADPYLNGAVDDFRIYNRAISSSEVTTLASSGTPTSTPTRTNTPAGPTYTPTRTPTPAGPNQVVNTYGRLQISSAQLKDHNGNAIQLAGMSSHGLTWFPLIDLNMNNSTNINTLKQQITFNPTQGSPFPYTSSAITNMVNQWHIQVIRASMFPYDPWNGADAKSYDNNYPEWKWYNINLVNAIVQSAINNNIYVIIDWHAGEGNDYDPTPYWTSGHVQEFFTYMVDKWGSYPNVIYETVNSPTYVSWSTLKTFNQNVINHIRSRESANGYAANLIIAGTPTWSQDVDVATADPLSGNLIAYNFMWYAGTHGQGMRDKGNTAITNLTYNTPNQTLFMGEVGTSQSNGTGGVYYTEFNTWMEWAKTNKLSWLNWSIADKEEASAVFVPSILGNVPNNEIAWRGGDGGSILPALASTGYQMRVGPWSDTLDLSCSGKFIKGWILYNTSQSVPTGC